PDLYFVHALAADELPQIPDELAREQATTRRRLGRPDREENAVDLRPAFGVAGCALRRIAQRFPEALVVKIKLAFVGDVELHIVADFSATVLSYACIVEFDETLVETRDV